MRAHALWLTCLVSGVLASAAFAHGGAYQPPPDAVRGGAVPPGVPGAEEPAVPGGSPAGPITPGSGPEPTPGESPDGGLPGVPAPGGSAGGLRQLGLTYPGPWETWWYANRALLLEGRLARASDRFRAARTGGERDVPARDQLWRAEARVALLEALDDGDPDVESGAAVAIGKAGHPEDAAALTRVLLDGARHRSVREAAALGLGLLPTDGSVPNRTARQALEGLVTFGAEKTRLRAMAVYSLGLRGEAASLPLLLDASVTGGSTWDVPCAGITALGLSSVELVRADLEGLLDGPAAPAKRKRETVRRVYAAHALALIGDARSLPALRRAARDAEQQVRRAAMLALARIATPDDDETAGLLAHTLSRGKDHPSRAVAAIAIGRLGCPRAESMLRYASGSGPRLVRPFATLGLGLLAARPECASARARLLNDLERDPSGAVCIAVGLAGDERAAPALRRVFEESRDAELRAHAALALGLVGDRKDSPPLLRAALLDSTQPAVQREAALALGMLGDGDAVRVLLNLLEESDTSYAKGSAAVALGRIGGEKTSVALVRMLRDRKQAGLARAMAAVSLGLLLDTGGGGRLAEIGADLNWYLFTPTVSEILTIL